MTTCFSSLPMSVLADETLQDLQLKTDGNTWPCIKVGIGETHSLKSKAGLEMIEHKPKTIKPKRDKALLMVLKLPLYFHNRGINFSSWFWWMLDIGSQSKIQWVGCCSPSPSSSPKHQFIQVLDMVSQIREKFRKETVSKKFSSYPNKLVLTPEGYKTHDHTLVITSTSTNLRSWIFNISIQNKGSTQTMPREKGKKTNPQVPWEQMVSQGLKFWEDFCVDGQTTSEVRDTLYACHYLLHHFIAADMSTARTSSCQCLLSWKRSKK